MSEQGTPPPGWYPDGEGWERRWDGNAWTEDRRPAGGAAPGRPEAPGTPPPAAATQMAGPPAGQPPAGPPGGYGPPGGSPYAQGGPGSPYGSGPGDAGGYAPPGGATGFGGPAYQQQPKDKKKLLPVIIAAAVVLVLLIGGGIAFAVTQLGGGDEKSDEKAGEGKDGGGDEGGEEGGEGGETDVAARSDFDGDGNGDAAGIFFDGDDFDFVTLNSDGKQFEVTQERGDSASMLWEDWDGDGTGTPLLYSFSSYEGELKIEGLDSGSWDEETYDFNLWEEMSYYVRVDSGDFDGDDTPDLVVMGQTGPLEVTYWFLKGTGDGFEKPEEWGKTKNATYGSTFLFPGDWDADGTDDLLALLPTENIPKDERDSGYYGGKSGVALLKSSGESFEQEGDLADAPFERFNTLSNFTIGDFRGDGTTLLALHGVDYTTQDIKFYEFADGELAEVDDLEADYESSYARGMTASDVNGDGKADLVVGRPDGEDPSEAENLVIEVLLAEGDGFAEAAEWGKLECGESCSIYFDNDRGL